MRSDPLTGFSSGHLFILLLYVQCVMKAVYIDARNARLDKINPLAPELFFFLILAHPVYKM